ncbi:SLOG family protein [Oscillospiraceae bacterium WX1]
MRAKTCCVIGHRYIPAEKLEYLKRELRREILQAVNEGYLHYISGFADGVDLCFAAIILELKRKNPSLTLEAAIPYKKRFLQLLNNSQTKKMLMECSAIGIHSEKYHGNCFMNRNRFMVRHSSRVIAVYDGRDKGNTVFTMRVAAMLNRDIRVIEI